MSDIPKVLVELLGTFFFVSIILTTLDKSIGLIAPFVVAAGLLAAILFGGKISGGHFNPVVSISMFFKDQISLNLMISYILFQIIGASLAVIFNNYLYIYI